MPVATKLAAMKYLHLSMRAERVKYIEERTPNSGREVAIKVLPAVFGWEAKSY
jgi:hypothetical protein